MAYQVESDLESISSEWNKQYSVAYYARLKYGLGASDQTLKDAIDSNNLRWAGEHVFGLNYHEYSLRLKDNVLFSPDFGNRSLVDMCRDAVLIREKAGVDLTRAESEKLGVEKLEKILSEMLIGQTAILISPPDPNDSNMAGYSMIYVYEKQQNGIVRATAVRDNASDIGDLQILAGSLTGVMPNWQGIDHLSFVAKPFVTNLQFGELVGIVGGSERDRLPVWLNDLSRTVARAMLYELSRGDSDEAKKIFDAFQMAVKIRYEQEKNGNKEVLWIEPMRAVKDVNLWIQAQRSFLAMGGMEMIKAGGSCGAGDIGLKKDEWSDNNIMSSLMGVNELETSETTSKMECVTCPFCKRTVDAIVTASHIECPKCHEKVSKG